MRNVTWIVAAGLAASLAGCNSPYGTGYGAGSGYGYAPGGYSSGYSQGYAPAYSGGYAPTYYRQPAVNNYYVQPQPRVITNTRYVPVPTAPDRRWDNNNGPDRRWGNNNNNNGNNGPDRRWNNNPGQTQGQPGDHRPQQHDWRPTGGGGQQAGNQPAPHAPPAATPQSPRQRGSSQDRDGDGKPDRH